MPAIVNYLQGQPVDRISDKAVYLYAEILYECGATLHDRHGPREEALGYVNRMIQRGHHSENLTRLQTELERLVRARAAQ
jgi:hypothetical protein